MATIVNAQTKPLVVVTGRTQPAVVVVQAQGPPGADGAAGGADKHYEHIQGVAASVWSVAHNLDKYAAVTVVTSAGDVVEGDVNYVDANNLIIIFTAAFAGRAFCN